MGRRPCCSKQGLNRGLWSAKEDRILTNYIKVHGEGKWRDLPQRAGLKRCGKSCRLRWLNYLKPDIKRGNISKEEDELIIRLHKLLGNRWSLIAGRLPGRTDNEIKNYWNSNLSKRFQSNKSPPGFKKQRVDPVKMKPELGHQVIRTKAVRCTKVVDIPRIIAPLEVKNTNNVFEGHMDSDGGTSCDFPFGLRQDLLMDVEIGDILLPESPNQANYCQENIREEGGILPSVDLPDLENYCSTDRTDGLEDYTRPFSCDHFQPNGGAFDLGSLTTFLISEEEWPWP